MRFATVLLATVLFAMLGPRVHAQERAPTWGDVGGRIERGVEDALDGVAALTRVPPPLVGVLLPPDGDSHAAALLPDQWTPLAERESAPHRLVLLVHGLDEPGDIWCDLAPALVEAGHAVARFEYPNDQHVVDSGAAMLAALRQARSQGVTDVSIIAHSMGGLVTLDALTRDGASSPEAADGSDLPRVERFIAVGTPWRGSPWAAWRGVTEVREQVQRWAASDAWDLTPMLRGRGDGRGQAAEDLAEGSSILAELSKRALSPQIRLTLIAGSIGGNDEAELSWMDQSRLLREVVGREGVADLKRTIMQKGRRLGDGVVPIRSALGRQTDDQVTLSANHRGLLRRTPIDFVTAAEASEAPPAIAVILERLEDQLPAGSSDD